MKVFLTLLPLFSSAAANAQVASAADPGMKTVVQVAIVCKDIETTARRWAAVLGVEPPAIRTTRPGNEVKMTFRGKPSAGQAKLAFLRAGQVTIELIQPVGTGTSWREFLDKHGEGVQHVAFQVRDLESTVKSMAAAGMPAMHQGRYDGDNGTYVYLDSEAALGVALELLHSDPKK